MILDLDQPSTWHEPYTPLFDDDAIVRVKKAADVEDAACRLMAELSCASEFATDQAALTLRQRCMDVFFGSYTHVIACHGCRVRNPADYLNHGVRQSDPEQLVEDLLDMAPDHSTEIRAVAQDLGWRYFAWNRGMVCFLLSQKWAVAEKTAYARGSELIRGILNRSNPEIAQRYFSDGTPSLIRCRIPVDWLVEYSRTGAVHETYATTPLCTMLRKKFISSWDAEGATWTEGGFRLEKSIPPELIECIVDMSKYVNNGVKGSH